MTARSPYRVFLDDLTTIEASITELNAAKKMAKCWLDFLKENEHNSSPPLDMIPPKMLVFILRVKASDELSAEECKEGLKTLAAYFQTISNYYSFMHDHDDQIANAKSSNDQQ